MIWGFILPVVREDPSRAAHPGPTGQGRAQREAKGRSLAAADGDAAAISGFRLHAIPASPIPFRCLVPCCFFHGSTAVAGLGLPKG
jgi:hypothetical protein